MRLEALQELFLAKHPTGALSRARQGEFFVQFRAGGRIYRYRDTVSGLAERLGLVPARDGWIMEVPAGRDEYGRLVAKYYINVDQDDWSSTIERSEG